MQRDKDESEGIFRDAWYSDSNAMFISLQRIKTILTTYNLHPTTIQQSFEGDIEIE